VAQFVRRRRINGSMDPNDLHAFARLWLMRKTPDPNTP